ncbi:MAG: hypothetical protein WAM26_03535 [Nitrososphaeraceae archaeon]
MKRNAKLTLPVVLGVISLLASSILVSPSFNLAVKAQGQNQSSSPEMSQQVQQKLDELAQKFRGLVNNSGANLSLPQDGNLSERLQTLVDSPQFKNLTQQLSQQMSQLGVNGSNIKNLQQERGGADFSGLVQKFDAQTEPLKCQRGALIGYGGTVFGLADVCTNGHRIDVDIATNFIPQSGKVFEAWLVDDAFEGSGYALSMGKILATGTLDFREVMNNAMTYTDIVITQEPDNDPSPLASWSNSVAETWLIPPFGQ